MLRSLLALALALALPIVGGPASAGEAEIHVLDPWARPSIPNRPAAAYMGLHNHQGVPDRLIAAASPRADSVELHSVEKEGGVMKMTRVEAIEIGADDAVLLEPGGYHLMLFGLDAPLKAGETLALTLTFDAAGEVAVTVPVERR